MMAETIHYWWWFGFALIMLSLVALTALDFLLWLGIAGVVTAVISMIWPTLDWRLQFMLFSVIAISTLILWWRYWRNPVISDKPYLNQRGANYIGRIFTPDQAIVNGYGKIHVDDTMWKVRCEDCAAGTRLKVVAVEGVILVAEIDRAADV